MAVKATSVRAVIVLGNLAGAGHGREHKHAAVLACRRALVKQTVALPPDGVVLLGFGTSRGSTAILKGDESWLLPHRRYLLPKWQDGKHAMVLDCASRGQCFAWVILPRSILTAFKEKGMQSGVGVWFGMCRLTIPLMFLIMWLAQLILFSPAAQTWTQDQRLNAQNVVQALNSHNKEAQRENSGVTGIIDKEEIQLMIVNTRTTYNYATAVRDDVLDKIHPDLKYHWKNEFVEGLRLRISNLENGDLQAEVRGSALLDKFGDWFEMNRSEIRIPK